MPLLKHQRSDFVHLDSVEPDLWTRISALFRNVLLDDSTPISVQQTDTAAVHSMEVRTMAAFTGGFLDYEVVSKFGRHIGIDNAATADIWTNAADRVWLSGAVQLEAIGGDGNDDAAGSGAQQIVVQGLDENFDSVEETITMNGTSASVATTATFIRVNRAYVSRTGTYLGSNDGLITIRTSGAGATQANIVALKGQTEQTHYSLPRNKQALLMYVYVATDGTKVIDAEIFRNTGIDDVTTPFAGARRKIWGTTGLQGSDDHKYEACPLLIGPCDIWWTVTSHANGTGVEAGFDLLIKDL